jgi:hypothetical protein
VARPPVVCVSPNQATPGASAGLGLDRLDEVWAGVLHMVPAPNDAHADIAQQLAIPLDTPARTAGLFPTMHEINLRDSQDDFRVPDGGLTARRWGT